METELNQQTTPSDCYFHYVTYDQEVPSLRNWFRDAFSIFGNRPRNADVESHHIVQHEQGHDADSSFIRVGGLPETDSESPKFLNHKDKVHINSNSTITAEDENGIMQQWRIQPEEPPAGTIFMEFTVDTVPIPAKDLKIVKKKVYGVLL